jgi:hypothetical protein
MSETEQGTQPTDPQLNPDLQKGTTFRHMNGDEVELVSTAKNATTGGLDLQFRPKGAGEEARLLTMPIAEFFKQQLNPETGQVNTRYTKTG